MNLRLLLLSSFTIMAMACSSESNGPTADAGTSDAPATSDAGTHMDAGSDTSAATEGGTDAAQACNTLANVAPTVTTDQVAAEPPAPQGGVIADGTYALTGVSIYTGPNGPTGASGTEQTTIAIAGSTVQIVSTGQPATRTVTLTTSGTDFTSTDTCPDTSVVQGTYTATATTLVVAFPGGTDDAGARTVVETFTKQ